MQLHKGTFMRLAKSTLSALLASTLVAAPIAAQAAPVAGSRTSADVAGEGQILEGVGAVGIGFFVVVIVLVAYLAFVEDEDEEPRSP